MGGAIVGVGTRVLLGRGVHNSQTDVVHLVSEAASWGRSTADGGKPTETGRYMNTKSSAVVAIVYFSIVRCRAR